MPSGQNEVVVGREQSQPVPNAQLREQGIDGADLHTGAATAVPQLSGPDVIVPVRRKQRQIVEVVDDRLARPRPGEALQKLLQDQPGRDDHIAALQGVAKRTHLGRGWDMVSA